MAKAINNQIDAIFEYYVVYRYHSDIKGRYHMSSSSFNLRGVLSKVMALLKKEAQRLRISVNALVLKMIECGVGFVNKKMVHHDLDHLVSSWSKAEEKMFTKNTQSFEQIVSPKKVVINYV